MQRPPNSSARSGSTASPKRRETTTPRASVFTAPRCNRPTTRSSPNRSTAPSPAGIRPRNACSDIPRRRRSGKSIDLIVPPSGRRRCRRSCAGSRCGERIENYETVRLRKDGSPVQVSLSDLADQVAVRRDHRRVQDRPRHHREPENRAGAPPADRGAPPHLRNLAGSDPDHRFQGQSWFRSARAAETILGYPPEEMIGRNAIEFHPSRRPRERPRGDARRAARRNARRSPMRASSTRTAGGMAVVDGRLVRAGQAAFLRRPRHDRKPAGAGDLARERATGAQHHRDRARRLRPDRRERRDPELEFAGGEDLRLAARGSARQGTDRPDHRRTIHRDDSQAGIASASCAPGRARSSDAASRSRPCGATARSSRSSSASPR